MANANLAAQKRDGMTTIINLGKTMCRLVLSFKPVILAKYSTVPSIVALLSAIEAVCELLPAAESDWYDPSGDNTIPSDDPSEIAGIDPEAPAPPPLPE